MARGIGRSAMLGAVVAALALYTGVAAAQPGPGRGMMLGGPGMVEGTWTTARYVHALKVRIGITAAEEPAWQDYAETLDGVSEHLEAMHRTLFQSMGTATWQESRNMMNRMIEARQEGYARVHKAAVVLLAVLDPGQRAIAKQILPGLAYAPAMTGKWSEPTGSSADGRKTGR